MKNTKQAFKILFIVFLFAQFNVQAQFTGQQVRLYTGMSVQPRYDALFDYEDFKVQAVIIGNNQQPIPFWAFSYMNNKASGKFWELGANFFPTISIKVEEKSDTSFFWSILARDKNRYYQVFFERGRSIGQHRKAARNAYFGWFLRANAHFYEFDSQVENRFFDEEHSRIGLQFGVTARYQAKFGKRVNLEFSLPVMLMQVDYNSSYIHNPAWPRAVNQNSHLETGYGIGLAQVRVGIGFLLGKINTNSEG